MPLMDETKVCNGCDGRGWVLVENTTAGVFGPDVKQKAQKCPVCNGKGKVAA